ncbi:MAG: porin [Hyphomicrobium sp.]
MKKLSLSALVAAGLMAGTVATSANAADLGGNCCADLEERIAELEATTVRKGNRKVTLTLSGWVAQQVMWWDDGKESNTYIQDVGSVSIGTHFKLSGQANIHPNLTAGYVLNIEAISNDSLLTSQDTDESILGPQNAQSLVGSNTQGALAVESSYWWVKHDTYGRFSMGIQSSAADNQAILPDGSGSLVVANYVLYDMNAFFLRRSDRGTRQSFVGGAAAGTFGRFMADCATLNASGGVAADCDGYPNANIKYDSPTFAGFAISASWGEDDIWAISARYAGEMHGFKIAAAVAYNESTDENGPGGLNQKNFVDTTGNAVPFGGRDTDYHAAAFQIGAYVQHIATGLFLYAAYGEETDVDVASNDGEPEGDNWYIKAGLRTRLSALGHSVFYAEYGENDDKFISQAFDAGVRNAELQQYGIGVVQEIDSAAMSMWLAYRHYEPEIFCADQAAGSCAAINLNNGASTPLEEFDLIKFGALISF